MEMLKNLKIIYKTLLVGGLVITILLGIAGYLFTESEKQLVADLQNAELQRSNDAIDTLLADERKKLANDLSFDGEVLSQIVGPLLYNLSDANKTIESFLKVPEVEAIVVYDSEGKEDYASGWKEANAIKFAKTLGGGFSKTELGQVKFDIKYNGSKIGDLFIFYSDKLLQARMDKMKKKSIKEQEKSMAQVNTIMNKTIAAQFFGFIAIIAITLIAFALVLRLVVVTPIKTISSALQEIAEGGGDLTQRIHARSKDELGDLSHWFNVFIEHIEDVVREITLSSRDVGSSSKQMVDVSADLVKISTKVSQQSVSVASATEELSTNIDTTASATEQMSVNVASVSSTAEEMSSNMNTVAAATEEMSQAIQHIAENAREGASVASEAQMMATDATSTMSQLGEAASEIGQVTEVIKRIAEQTNLLALNATIEAASAGDAGKGFAVVANEIKELANQSAKAAEDISSRIEGVQQNSNQAVTVIEDITNIIEKINNEVGMISKSVEQQTSTSNEIAANVAEANVGVNNIASSIGEVASGSNEVSKSTMEAAKATNEVSENIAGISSSIHETDNTVGAVNKLTENLSEIAGKLDTIVGKFKINMDPDKKDNEAEVISDTSVDSEEEV